MPDNLQTASPMPFALTDHRLVTLEGADAIGFAQAQFINDVSGLQSGTWHWSGWLTPKGRVLALFALIRRDDGSLWLLVPDIDPVAFADSLRRFIFRSKVKISVPETAHIEACFEPAEKARDSHWALMIGSEVIELDVSAEGGPRRLRITQDTPNPDTVEPSATEHGDIARWRAFDLQHGWPRLSPSQLEQWTPQQLSLDRLKAYSIKKGCYPGQEIVARTHFLGKAKRALALVEAQNPLAEGAEIQAGGKPSGRLVSVAAMADRYLGLAVLPLEHETDQLTADAIALTECPLLGGLAR